MPADRAEPERLQQLLRDLRRVDLREPEGPRAESAEQLLQTGTTVLDASAFAKATADLAGAGRVATPATAKAGARGGPKASLRSRGSLAALARLVH